MGKKRDHAELPRGLRFEVLKRDKFTCQYCGGKSPDVVLHVDHVVPRAEGGSDSILNLVASCADCNLGKGAIPLSDGAAVSKQRARLEEAADRREQIAMIADWQRELMNLPEVELTEVCNLFAEWIPGRCVSESGKAQVRKLLSRFGLQATIEALRFAIGQYLKHTNSGAVDFSSVGIVFEKWGAIAWVRSREAAGDDSISRLFRIRKLLERQLQGKWYDAERAIQILKKAHRSGVSLETLEYASERASSWSDWRHAVGDCPSTTRRGRYARA